MDREGLGRLYPIEFVEYDREWPSLFLKERDILVSIWGPGLRMEHIGSTAVPGMAAKPTIDMLMERPHDMEDGEIVGTMVRNGYVHMKEQTRHLMFVKGYGEKGLEKESFHIHVGPLDQEWLWDRVYFRDLLRSDEEEARRYEDLKMGLAVKHRNDREAYTDAKSGYIERVTKMAKGMMERPGRSLRER